MKNESEIADRVARKVIGGGLNVPASDKAGRAVAVHIEVEEGLCRVGVNYFDKSQLDTLIDTLKMAQRRM